MKQMKRLTKSLMFMILTMFMTMASVFAQVDKEYVKVTNERAKKIVNKLDIDDQSKAVRVQDIIAIQYRDLNAIHENRDLSQSKIKSDYKENKVQLDKHLEKLKRKTDKKVASLHKNFLRKLSKEIGPDKIDKIKDGLTYDVMPITYTGYVEMLPLLTDKQKSQLFDFLKEAREIAMDKGSSKEKHAVFGQYKGKINNYLSAEGVETKIAREVWEKKLKERQSASQK
jgi:hypothetical protein